MSKWNGWCVFIDPGKHACAYAHMFDRELRRVEYRKPYTLSGPGVTPSRVVCEMPEQRGAGSRVRVADLLSLAWHAGQAAGPIGEQVRVRDWKGSREKKEMHSKLFDILSAAEQIALSEGLYSIRKSDQHNVFDAVCVALVMTGRMAR